MRKNSLLLMSVFFMYYSISLAQNSDKWVLIDSLKLARCFPSTVLLPNGDVMVGGGEGTDDKGNSMRLSSCEIYGLSTAKWRFTNSMNKPRLGSKFILLKTGKVLAVGGYEQRSCELFDPNTETWALTDSLLTKRSTNYSVTMLKDGRVLVCGGFKYADDYSASYYLRDCEIYDPETGEWTPAAPLNYGRANHTATLLKDGRVLIAGGFSDSSDSDSFELRSVEIYDSNLNKWTVTDSLTETRSQASAILLPNGNVFISGGEGWGIGGAYFRKTCEVYVVTENKWTSINEMQDFRENQVIYYLDDNTLLIMGGAIGQASKEDTWETYDAVNLKPLDYGIFPIKKMFTVDNTAQLKDGRVIIAGGEDYDFSQWDGMPYRWFSKTCLLSDIWTSVETREKIPANYHLYQNYPNPFNPTTKIMYSLTKSCFVKLDVYNSIGQRVKSLINNFQNAGTYEIVFDARDQPSGVFFYRIIAGLYSEIRKMLLIK